jgi:hypothetical protein
MFSSGTSVCLCLLSIKTENSSVNLDIGSTRTSSGKRTPNSLHYHSRNFPPCYSTHALYFTNGVTITNKRSTRLCNTKQEFLFVVRSCSMTHGKRFVTFVFFWRDLRLKTAFVYAVHPCQGLEIIFRVGLPQRKD